MESEIWKPVPGLDDYQVSTLGNVRSKRRGSFYLCDIKPNKRGYRRTTCTTNKGTKNFFVSHLVLNTFVGIRPSKNHQCAHGDGNSANDSLSNLRWATPKENTGDKAKHGTNLVGEKHNMVKLRNEDVLFIRANYRPRVIGKYKSNVGLLATKFKVSKATIINIVELKNWKHI